MRIAAGLALLALAGCAAPAGGQITPVPVAGARMSPAPLLGKLTLPPGAGPHPVVILLHGCGGISPSHAIWRDRLSGWGYGVLVLDSFTSRGVTTVCAQAAQALVTRYDRAADVAAAVRWLQGQPGVDGQRVAVLGLSHGGGTAATVTLHPFADAMGGAVKGVVDYYGPCREPERYAGLPVLALAGDKDTWGNPARSCTAFGAALPQGSPFEAVVYPGAVHQFDNPRQVGVAWGEGHPMQYDADAAEDSFVRVRAFLARVLGPAG